MDVYDSVGPDLPGRREAASRRRELELLADELGYEVARAKGIRVTRVEFAEAWLKLQELDRQRDAELQQAQANFAGSHEIDAIHGRYIEAAIPLETVLAA